ncbi:MAG: hypothetical protein LBC84_07715 [Prevotellaceae bacterium]|nr:hypothetical protein [Prevotellaceae bacterium]
MKGKTITKGYADKSLGIPTVFVRLHGTASFGFNFLIDTSVRHNLLDPCFYKEWIVPRKEESQISTFWAQFPPVTATYQEKGNKRVVCKDGVRRVCDMIKLDFTIDNKKYSELFALDYSLCPCFHSRGSKAIAGVLGNGFLLRQKWVLDYSGM